MLGAGLEPARPCGQGILSPLCLPIPPPERTYEVERIKLLNINLSECKDQVSLSLRVVLDVSMISTTFSSEELKPLTIEGSRGPFLSP